MKASKPTLADLRQLQAKAEEESVQPATTDRTPSRGRPRPTAARKATTPPGGSVHTDGNAVQGTAPLDPADRALLEQAMRYVRPLVRHGNRARSRVQRGEPDALLRMRRTRAQGEDAAEKRPVSRGHRRTPSALDPDAHEFLQAGCGTDVLRDLRRGKWLPEAILDLHGSTEEQAHERLDRFVTTCVEHGIRCVRIVHGKGIGSRHGAPVLKTAARIHLCRLTAVQAWVECAEPDGGAGAVTVLLQLPPQSS